MKIEVCDWHRVDEFMRDHAKKVHCGQRDDYPVRALVFFDPVKSHWTANRAYTNASRCYRISSGCKFWHPECGGNSLYGECVDSSDPDSNGIRLDWYMFCENPWVVDFCVLIY